MAQSLLQILPLELRNKIYRYVLESPTGSIYLSRTIFHQKPIRYRIDTGDDPSEVISLSFLRTCRQIYEEAKDGLWKWNTVDLDMLRERNVTTRDSFNMLHRSIRMGIQNAKLGLHLSDECYGECLIALSVVSWWQSLRSISIVSYDCEGSDGHSSMVRTLEHFMASEFGVTPFELFLRELRVLGHRLNHVERRIHFDMGPPAFLDPSQSPTIYFDRVDPRPLFRDLNEAFGGQLWVNNILYYEDGNPVDEVFYESEASKSILYYKKDIEALERARAKVSSKELSNLRSVLLLVLAEDAKYFNWPDSYRRPPGCSDEEALEQIQAKMGDKYSIVFWPERPERASI